jgi:cyanate permease
MAIVTVLFGWFYGWASPWAFPKNHPADFKFGVLHGALMPLSLPTLVMGKDVAIYAADNSGRGYKIGYICGINACGLIFFGAAFRKPKTTSTNSGKSQ